MKLIYPTKDKIIEFFQTHSGFHTVIRISELLVAFDHNNVQDEEWRYIRESLHTLKAEGFLLIENEGKDIYNEQFSSTPDRIRNYFQVDKPADVGESIEISKNLKILLNNPKYSKRTFESLKKRFVGLKDGELRKNLRKIGAISFKNLQNKEMWGFGDKDSAKQDLEKLRKKIEGIEKLKIAPEWGSDYQLWIDLTERLVKGIFGSEGLKLFQQQNSVTLDDDAYTRELEDRKNILNGLIANKNEYQPDLVDNLSKNKNTTKQIFNIKDSQLHLGKGDNVGRNKIAQPKDGIWSRYWWSLFIPVTVGLIIFAITGGKILQPVNINVVKDRGSATSTIDVSEILLKINSMDTSLEKKNFLANYINTEVYGEGAFRDLDESGGEIYLLDLIVEKNLLTCVFINVTTETRNKLLLFKKGDQITFKGMFTDKGYFGRGRGIDNCFLIN